MDCWQVLGIKPTNNLKAIKRAYAAKSREVHPEEHPEEFRLLHDSYQTAIELAKTYKMDFDVEEAEIHEEQAATADLKKDTDDLFAAIDSAGAYEAAYNLSGDESELSDESGQDDTESADESDIDFDEILENADEEHARKVIDATNAVMNSLDMAVSEPKERERLRAVKNVVSSKFFSECYDIPYFAGELTDFVKTHHDLTDAFYGTMYNALRFDILETREQKGMYEELFFIFTHRGKTGVYALRFANQMYEPSFEESKPFWNPKARIKELRYFSRVTIATAFVPIDFVLIWVLGEMYKESDANFFITLIASIAAPIVLVYFLIVNTIIFIKSRVTGEKPIKFKSRRGELNLTAIFITVVFIDIWFLALALLCAM